MDIILIIHDRILLVENGTLKGFLLPILSGESATSKKPFTLMPSPLLFLVKVPFSFPIQDIIVHSKLIFLSSTYYLNLNSWSLINGLNSWLNKWSIVGFSINGRSYSLCF